MNKTGNDSPFSFLLRLMIFSAVLFGLHYALLHYMLRIHDIFYPLWQSYGFHIVTVFLVYAVIKQQYTRGGKRIFQVFMALTLFKMALAVIFLLPLLYSDLENKQPDVFNFFIPYFLFLAMEVWSISGFLRRS